MRGKTFLSTDQYGSINGRPTTKKLSSYIDNCIDSTAAGGEVNTRYLDFVMTSQKKLYTIRVMPRLTIK